MAPDSEGTRAEVARIHERLVREVLPHEHAEEHRLYPALARPLGGDQATATMSRMHREIDHLVERIGVHLRDSPGPRLPAERVPDLLASMYGLEAILRLHMSHEEEHYFSLASR